MTAVPHRRRRLPVVAAAWMAALGLALPAPAAPGGENIDPDGDGSRYAYGENVGWLNAEPAGDGGPGVQVGDLALTGYLWGENIGWVSLSCENTASCPAVGYGVANDGAGILSGYAWAENAGWISFSCANTASCGTAAYGVTIDPASGVFAGRAWGENVGFISFASNGPHPYRVKTGWSACAAPAGSPAVTVTRVGTDAVLAWGGVPQAAAYDVVRGSLDALHAKGGFAAATLGCLADDAVSQGATDTAVPPGGDGFWYLVRPVGCSPGSYDGAGQAAPRDPGVLASGHDCP